MYSIKMRCYDPGNPIPYVDYPSNNKTFESKLEALEFAYWLSDDECDSLNDGAIPGVSFGTVVDEDEYRVYTCYYYNESETDCTGNTEIVTIYIVEETNKVSRKGGKSCSKKSSLRQQ